MLKRIPSDQLRLGMHLHSLCGSWMDHPFWRTRFTLDDPKDIQRVIESGIAEVWIDTSRGLDVTGAAPTPALPPALTEAPASPSVEPLLAAASPPAAPTASAPMAPAPTASLAEELHRAQVVMRQSREQVVSMFADARLGKAVDTRACLPLVEEISTSVMRNPNALVSLARLKRQDDYTYMHSVAVCALMVNLARHLGLPEDQVREAGLAGMLHDIGKAMMPLSVLNKPAKLTEAEFDIMRSHPQRGHAILEAGKAVGATALDVCLHHHERIDGTGYPHRLAGGQISLMARMGAVCDVYDAVTSERPYKRGWSPGDALRRMVQWKGHFDPAVFQAFVKSVGIYPVGSVVRLESARLAVVVEQRDEALLTPVVKAFFSTKSGMGIAPEVIDLGRPGCADRIVGVEPEGAWSGAAIDELWLPQGVKPLR